MRSVLRLPSFRRLLLAAAVSQAGDWLYTVALVVFVFDATRSATWVAAVTLVRMGPYVLLEAFAGLFADRYELRLVLVVSDLLRTLVMALLAIVVLSDGPVLLALILTGLSTIASAPYPPAVAAAVPGLVGEERLVAANGMLSTVENVAIIVGPSLGALLLLAGPPGLAVAINALTFLVSAVAVAGLPRSPAPAEPPKEASSSAWQSLTAGWQALLGSRLALIVIAFAVVDHLLYGMDTVLLLLVSGSVGTGSSGVGYLFAAVGLGGVLVAVFGGRLVAFPRSGTVLAIAMVAYALPTAALAGVSAPAVAFGLEVVHGAGFVLIELVAVTALQRALPRTVLGRIFGLYGSAVVAGILFGALTAPALASWIGLDGTLLVAGLAPAVLAVMVLPWLRFVDGAAGAGLDIFAPRLAVLARLDIFGSAPRPMLERLADAATVERVPAGTVVIRQGEPARDFYAIESGWLTVLSTGERGGTRQPVNRLGADGYFGEIGLLTGAPRTADVEAEEDCVLLRIGGADFLDSIAMMGTSPLLHETMAARLARTHPSQRLRTPG